MPNLGLMEILLVLLFFVGGPIAIFVGGVAYGRRIERAKQPQAATPTLVSCPDCQRRVSPQARSCPQCGRPAGN